MVGGVWGVCMAWACMVGDVHSREEPAWRGVEGGVHGKGGACVAGETAIAVGGTHPTGMHSCLHFDMTD